MSSPIGLYVHIPFCARKCAYCDFASFAGREADQAAYVDRLIREMGERSRPDLPIGTLYIGGYYGPDPVAISADGRVLWQADCSAYSAQWMTSMELLENGISCWYGSMKDDTGETTGTVTYDFNGAITEVIFD